jgi:glycosyltransferase involved in cell wall biosynthesis
MTIAVDVIMRSNFRETRGGDVAQIENSLRPLGDRVDVRYVAATAGMSLRPDAIHHIVNVDRPLDFLAALDQCGRRVVVSTIHHALPRIVAMQHAAGGDRKADFLPTPIRERVAFAFRASGGGHSGRSLAALARIARIGMAPGNMWHRLGRALDSVAHVALLAEVERADLIADTRWRGDNGIVIPNGCPPVPAEVAPWATRARGIVVVGRIEPRKRQLAIAQAAEKIGAAVTFIGPIADDAYGRQFRDCVARCPAIEWLGPRPAAETVALIATARVLLNASWVEVQSLVDIEAATAGCWVVTSPTGSSQEWLGDAVDRMASDDPAMLLAQAARRAAGGIAPPVVRYTHDWAMAGEALFGLYSRLLRPEERGLPR